MIAQSVNLVKSIYVVWGSSTHQDLGLSNKSNSSPLPIIGGMLFIQVKIILIIIVWGISVYQDACLSSLVWGIPTYQDVCISEHRIFPQPNMSSFLQNRFKILLFNIQWPSSKIATQGNSQEKVKQSKLQWPPKKVATLQTMAISK